MEALRNYVQHMGVFRFTLQRISHGGRTADHRYMEFSIRLVATREKLREPEGLRQTSWLKCH